MLEHTMSGHHPIDCERALQRLFEFIDHELGPEDRAAMEEHLRTCRSCFSRAEFERRLKEKLAGLRGQPDPSLDERLERLIRSL
jgi:anti-sigma factor (TIGR02949 family)